jgi:HlyD family secretion protein
MFSACARPSAAEPAAITPVTVATAVAPQSQPIFQGPGSVVAAHTYRVGFEIAGRVTDVRYDIGDRVAAGAILATIDAADYAAQYQAASARAASARAAAAKAAHGARTQERLAALDAVAAAQGQLDRAEAAAGLAAANRLRYDELFRDGDVSAEQHDATAAAGSDAAAQVAAAHVQLAQARAQNSLVASGSRSEDLAAADADARAAGAAAQLAAVTLNKTAIAAPADAYVQTRAIEPGSEAQPGGVAFTLTDAREPETLVAVPESKLPLIAPGTRAIVTVGGDRYAGSAASRRARAWSARARTWFGRAPPCVW